MPNVNYANVTDPLSAPASLVTCIDEGGAVACEPEWHDLPDATGGHLQSTARVFNSTPTIRYYAKGAVTRTNGTTCDIGGTSVFVVGATMGGFSIKSWKRTGDNNTGDEGVDVSCVQRYVGTIVEENSTAIS
jgi:hypothetical protein